MDSETIERIKPIVNSEEISRYHVDLKADDIIVDWNMLDYGMGNEDPFDHTKFYDPANDTVAFYAAMENRGIYPRSFVQYQLRIYCKNHGKLQFAQSAFSEFCNINNIGCYLSENPTVSNN